MEDPVLVQRGERSKSPIHIHVRDSIPVHVHVQKPAKLRQQTGNFADNRGRSLTHGFGNIRHGTNACKSTSQSPTTRTAAGFKKTSSSSLRSKSPGVKYSWQSGSHRLDILKPENEEDEDFVNRANKYEKELNGLKSEVGVLKNQVEHQRVLKELKEKENLLEEQEDELEKCKYELEATEIENRKLRLNIEKLCDEMDGGRAGPEMIGSLSGDHLIKKLLDVELDGEMLGKQALLYSEAASHMKDDQRPSSTDYSALNKSKITLDEAIERFSVSNRALRSLLLDRKELELNFGKVGEQRDLLLTKLSRVQNECQGLKSHLIEREHQISDLLVQLDAQKEENLAVSGQQSLLKITKAHLQNQLRQKEADCNQMAIQIRTLESQLTQERIDTDHLRGLLSQSKGRVDLDKEALKKATRIQKMRASKSEDALEQVKLQLMEKEAVIVEQHADLEMMQSQLNKVNKERSQALTELSTSKIRLEEVESLMDRMETEAKDRVETVTSKSHEKSYETSVLQLDNEHLKNSVVSLEHKLSHAAAEIEQLRSSIREYEPLMNEYRNEINRSQREADELQHQLERQKMETAKAKLNGEVEVDKVKSRFEGRVQELEAFPEKLHRSEMKLKDVNEAMRSLEARYLESVKLFDELTVKAEHQTNSLTDLQERYLHSEDKNKALLDKLDLMDKKLSSVEEQNRELISTNGKREDAFSQINLRLEEKMNENSSLQRQLDSAIADLRRLKEQQREKIAATERELKTQVVDLETRLSQCKAEISRLKREKEELERKSNSRLYDLKDELQQSYGSNRSLQNYVQFLKASYASSFNDLAGIQLLSPQRASFF